jgi:hypothetical protein
MTPIEKAKWLAEFYNAVAEGKTAQTHENGEWIDVRFEPLATNYAPNMMCNPSSWRIKPNPRRMWKYEAGGDVTYNRLVAAGWRKQGLTVTEWLEVV